MEIGKFVHFVGLFWGIFKKIETILSNYATRKTCSRFFAFLVSPSIAQFPTMQQLERALKTPQEN
jgi:hypothetical protein